MPDEIPVADRECQPINDDIGIHFWPFTDPPIGTACKCGEARRRRPRWHATPTTEETADHAQ